MKLSEFIRPDLVLPDLSSRRKKDVIRELAMHLGKAEGIDVAAINEVLLERESLGSTALGEGIAIPHAKLNSVDRLIGCVGRSRKGVDFGSDDGSDTHLFFVLIAPADSTGDHLKALARISRLFKKTGFREELVAASTADEIYSLIEREDAGTGQ